MTKKYFVYFYTYSINVVDGSTLLYEYFIQYTNNEKTLQLFDNDLKTLADRWNGNSHFVLNLDKFFDERQVDDHTRNGQFIKLQGVFDYPKSSFKLMEAAAREEVLHDFVIGHKTMHLFQPAKNSQHREYFIRLEDPYQEEVFILLNDNEQQLFFLYNDINDNQMPYNLSVHRPIHKSDLPKKCRIVRQKFIYGTAINKYIRRNYFDYLFSILYNNGIQNFFKDHWYFVFII